MPEPPSYVFPKPVPAVITKRHKPRDDLDLDLYPHEHVTVLEMKSEWWAIGRKRNGQEGWVHLPSSASSPSHNSHLVSPG